MKHVIPIAILATLIFLVFVTLSRGWLLSRYSPLSDNIGSPLIQERQPIRSGKTDPSRDRERVQTTDPQLQLSKLSKATAAIMRSLEDDEASRSVLLDEKKTSDSYQYHFEIERNPDLDGLISSLCVEHSNQKDINLLALKKAVADSIGEFKFPEGYSQEVWIKVPKDSSSETTFAMMPKNKVNGLGSGRGKLTMNSGSVSPTARGWRYEKLLELHPKEQPDVP